MTKLYKLLICILILCNNAQAEWVSGVWVRKGYEKRDAWYNNPRLNPKGKSYTTQNLKTLTLAHPSEYNRFYIGRAGREELLNKIRTDNEIQRRINQSDSSSFSIRQPLRCNKGTK